MKRRHTSRRGKRASTGLLARLSLSGLILAAAPLLPAPADGTTLAGSERRAPPSLSQLEREGWRLLRVPGKAQAVFAKRGADSIGVVADKAVAFLYRSLARGMDPKRRLVWTWRVDQAVAPTDLSRAPGDDRSLAVHLVFPVDPDRLSFWRRMDLALTRIVAPPMAGMVLTYVWGGTHPEGTVLMNPYLHEQGRIIVLRGGDPPVGQWFREEVDFVADFTKAFGYGPPTPSFIAISTDSDDTGGRISGAVAGLAFEG